MLKSDLEWDHFVLAESDPDIVDCNYGPERQISPFKDDEVSVPVDAIVTHRDGSIEWRRFEYGKTAEPVSAALEPERQLAAARSRGAYLSVWSNEVIRRNPLLLANWRRVLAWLAAARDRSLTTFEQELVSTFGSEAQFTLGQVETTFGEASFPLYAAALFGGLQRGTYESDLDAMPLSAHTVVCASRSL